MKKRARLTRQSDFQRLLGRPKVFQGRTLVAFALPSDLGRLRIGVATSRHIKGAVNRNRARRRLREAVRVGLLDAPCSAGFDIVVIARPGLVKLSLPLITEEVQEAYQRLLRRA